MNGPGALTAEVGTGLYGPRKVGHHLNAHANISQKRRETARLLGVNRGFGRRSGRKVRFPGNNDTADDKKEVRMAEERPQHTQEPAEGSDEDAGAAGAERAEEAEGNA